MGWGWEEPKRGEGRPDVVQLCSVLGTRAFSPVGRREAMPGFESRRDPTCLRGLPCSWEEPPTPARREGDRPGLGTAEVQNEQSPPTRSHLHQVYSAQVTVI